MSFPSIAAIAQSRGIDHTTLTDEHVARSLLAEAIKIDCAEAVSYLHALVHKADTEGKTITFAEDPNSTLGKQLMRLFAADEVREVVRIEFLHGREVTFYNCCGGDMPAKGEPKPRPSAIKQIKHQAGPIAYADC